MTLITTLLSIYGLVYFNPALYDLLADSNNLNSTYMMRMNENPCMSINYTSIQSIRNSMIELHSNRIIDVTKYDKGTIKFEHLTYNDRVTRPYKFSVISHYDPLHIKIIKLISFVHGYDELCHEYMMYFIKDDQFEAYSFRIDKSGSWTKFYTPMIKYVRYEYKILDPVIVLR